MATKKLKPVKTQSVSNDAAVVAATTNNQASATDVTQNTTTNNDTQTTTQTTETVSDQQVTEQTSDNQALATEVVQEAPPGETVTGGAGADVVEGASGEDTVGGASAQDTVSGGVGESNDNAQAASITEDPTLTTSSQESVSDAVIADTNNGGGDSMQEEHLPDKKEESEDMANTSGAIVVGDGTAAVGVANQAANAVGEAFVAAVYSAGENYWMNEYKILGYSETLTKTLLDILGIDSKATSTCKELLKSVLYYAHHMGPHSCGDEATNKLNQTKFFNDFTLFLNIGCDDFRKAMSVSLAIVNESVKNGTGFSGVLPFRYMESLSGPAQLREGITAIMHLLTTTADPAKRALTVKQVDVPKCVAFGVSEAGKQRLMDFYSA